MARNPVYIPYGKLDTDEKLTNDLKKIFASINPRVPLTKRTQGEIDSSFAVDAIMANFKRKCRSVLPEKMGGNVCITREQQIKFEVLPYKTGSKTTYTIDVPYYLSDKGESSYSAESTKNAIAAIEKIVKD